MKIIPDIIALNSTRVWRTYTGGRLIDEIGGSPVCRDTNFPEEWMMSVVRARNPGREEIEDEGLSRALEFDGQPTLKGLIEGNPAAMLGERHYKEFGAAAGVLVKLIDSAERLTIQTHPDKAAAQELFNSPFGKTECWHILGGRTIGGAPPCVYIGFKPGITREMWKELFGRQDGAGMLNCLHKFRVKKGDTFLIRGGVPHAIGAGCFLAEIQEPTDYSVRVERVTPSGLKIADSQCHQGLGFDRMFDVFKYVGLTRCETLGRCYIKPRAGRTAPKSGATVKRIVDYDNTPCFKMDALEICGGISLPSSETFYGFFILSGMGEISTPAGKRHVMAGEQFFVPALSAGITITNAAARPLEMLRWFPPKIQSRLSV